MQNSITLYRPIGPGQLTAIIRAHWREFPPRLAHQPFFFPLLDKQYAQRVARQWNLSNSGAGFVTQFKVQADFLDQYEPKRIGGPSNWEYRIPAHALVDFNQHILGQIQVVDAYFSQQPRMAEQLAFPPRHPIQQVAAMQAHTRLT